MFDYFYNRNPRNMSRHFFRNAKHMDYASAVKAEIQKQNFTVDPRHWCIDATVPCARCKDLFCFSAEEQKRWYEVLGFYVDSFPSHCLGCRCELRKLRATRQEYDRDIACALANDDCDSKVRIVFVIDQLCESDEDLPIKIHENRKVVAKQIARRNRLSNA